MCGVLTGCALLSKFTALILPPILIITLAFFLLSSEYRSSGHGWRRYAAGTLAALAVALAVLNAGYLFRGTGASLASVPVAGTAEELSVGGSYNATGYDELRWRSEFMQRLSESPAGSVPLPVPLLYLHGIDKQLYNSDKPIFKYYLNGEVSRDGWMLYYPEAFALKTPIPLLLLVACAVFFALAGRCGFYEKILLIVPVVFMLQFTFIVRVDLGLRYMLPVFPFLAVIGSGAAARIFEKGMFAKAAVAVLCFWYAGAIFTTFGNGLAYFNEFAGGPGGGHRYLVESNLDWGQNLVRLRDYEEREELSPLLVYNYGLVPPSAYGIEAGWVPCEPARAVVAISVNHLYGIDPFEKRPRECFDWLSDREPVAKIGGGLFVFDTREKPVKE